MLLDYSLLEFAPSQLAAAALLLAMHTRDQPALAARLLQVSGYAPQALERATTCVLQLHRNAAWPQSAPVRDLLAPVVGKYSQQAWCCAALAAPLLALDPAWFAAA